MKKNRFATLSILPLFFCASCGEVPKPTPTPTMTISLDRAEISFGANGGNEGIKVTANGPWSVSGESVSGWLSLDHTSGDGSTEITLTTKSNDS